MELRQNPYPILYNYWYAGGLPIAGSEAECLELMRFAAERGLRLGVHYCSLDNKNSGQIYQQNKGFLLDKAFAAAHGWLHFDEEDYFLKCVKAVGDDASPILGWALEKARVAANGAPSTTVRFVDYDESMQMLAFPCAWLVDARNVFPTADFIESLNVVELDGSGAPVVREVDARIV